jgi:hypothetical protein
MTMSTVVDQGGNRRDFVDKMCVTCLFYVMHNNGILLALNLAVVLLETKASVADKISLCLSVGY